ncbi:beta-ribofuranosylaminobenzene 5'-phosphate synthase family protein [Actinomadura sp. 7K534]|uniref:beta-ribofuranosylaminobenzene 5'-phosphate synthase family protein n=1 Tax=Actinomadura sp. 7K534 TaxID=2530366 RepID=UPI001053930E|nr:beta-ribofuranosylaminobenzene 5'-phosphate synthase family protein [Actinomadura sp. 7K534]TDB96619.1 hypothetical protein E1266_09380 [Actinomadura sp. 7K534]
MRRTLTAYPRLHLGLLDTAGISRRVYGGAGFSLDGPHMVIHAEPARRHTVEGGCLAPAEARRLTGLLETAGLPATSLIVERLPPRHVGLGTGTMLCLGTVAATAACHGLRLPPERLSLLSGRGGTSGIGWHAFWRGGFLVDCGQPNTGQAMRPSSAGAPRESPPLSVALPIPRHWAFALLMPASGTSVSGTRERDFFAEHTPTPERECLCAFAALYHSIVPAVANADLRLLRDGLAEFQSLGLKKAEISCQPFSVRALLETLHESGVPAGMSSLGPLVFAVHESGDAMSRSAILDAAERHGARIVASPRPRDFGHLMDGRTVTLPSGRAVPTPAPPLQAPAIPAP